MAAQINPRDCERIRGYVRSVDAGVFEVLGQQNGEAAGACAQVERAMNTALHRPVGRCILMQQQFSDVSTRHERALIDVKAMFSQPRLVGKVRGWYALLDASREKFDDLRCLHGSDRACGGKMFQRKLQGVQRQINCFVAGIGGAVPIGKSGIREPALAAARERADGSVRGFTSQVRRDSA